MRTPRLVQPVDPHNQEFRGHVDAHHLAHVRGDLLCDVSRPARHVEDQHVRREWLDPGGGADGSTGKGRSRTGEQPDLSGERVSNVLVRGFFVHVPLVQFRPVTVTADLANNLPETATPRARRHARRDGGDRRHLRLRRARSGHGLAFARPAPTRIRFPRDDRGRNRDRALPSSPAASRLDPGGSLAQFHPQRGANDLRVLCARVWFPTREDEPGYWRRRR